MPLHFKDKNRKHNRHDISKTDARCEPTFPFHVDKHRLMEEAGSLKETHAQTHTYAHTHYGWPHIQNVLVSLYWNINLTVIQSGGGVRWGGPVGDSPFSVAPFTGVESASFLALSAENRDH